MTGDSRGSHLRSGPVELRGYRVGRRAVVATPTSFVKVVRPSRIDALVQRHELLTRSARSSRFPR